MAFKSYEQDLQLREQLRFWTGFPF